LYSREGVNRFDEMLSIPLQQGGTFTGDNIPVVNTIQESNTGTMLIALDTNLETDHPFYFAAAKSGRTS
jgi:hypothetical protein